MKCILSDIAKLGPIIKFQLGPQSGIIFLHLHKVQDSSSTSLYCSLSADRLRLHTKIKLSTTTPLFQEDVVNKWQFIIFSPS
jgi:hypothetical protein